jgi:nitronate monooxygenase
VVRRPAGAVGLIASGGAILAAQAMGADFAYIGSAFIATDEARAVEGYKQMITESNSDDIVYSNFYTGIHGNYLKGSIRNAGMDPDNLPESDPSKMNFSTGEGGKRPKAWKDIWGCGQGIGAITEVVSTADMVAEREYREARERLLAMPYSSAAKRPLLRRSRAQPAHPRANHTRPPWAGGGGTARCFPGGCG